MTAAMIIHPSITEGEAAVLKAWPEGAATLAECDKGMVKGNKRIMGLFAVDGYAWVWIAGGYKAPVRKNRSDAYQVRWVTAKKRFKVGGA